ncbi:uncharacterized protein LOC134705311 [Mytilus trossulus]|uniref:uncharacterized protein LOC134705311 n=1 Tax=Mytilus trossulus TaxID=6551 RepID=UPI00300513D4
MKCVNPDCKAELAPTDNFCGQCRQKVEKNQHDLKKCPHCKSLQKASVKYCSNCSNEIYKEINCEVNPEKSHSENSLPLKSENIENSPENRTDIDAVDELDGRDRSDHQQPTVLNSTVEQGDLKPAEARGVVVICTHATFVNNKTASLTERQSATNDNDMMKEIWKLYDDCEVLAFEDESSSFYDSELEEKIKEKVKEIPEIKYFVFVLSTHGEDKPEVKLHDKPEGEFHDKGNLHHRHFFYTNDGQFETQKLMTKIDGIDGVKGKMKLFFIQACRSRYGKKLDNVDLGCDVIVTYPKGHFPEKTTETGGINKPDARADYTEFDEVYNKTPELNTENKVDEPKESVISEILPDVVLSHFEDCVVVFGSFTGKQAYRKDNSPDEGGGWMIKALHTTLDSYHKQEAVHNVHIIDILTEINKAVSMLSVLAPNDILEEMNMAKSEDYQLKAQSCFFHNLALEDEHMTLHKTKTK